MDLPVFAVLAEAGQPSFTRLDRHVAASAMRIASVVAVMIAFGWLVFDRDSTPESPRPDERLLSS